MRSMWKGTVSFGLVAIPIHLYAATESKSPSFRQVHEKDGGRIHYKRICSVDGEEVPYSEVAKGHETDDGEMVILTDEDLANVPVPSSKAVDVVEFVPLESIDPIYFDKSYYLEPQKAGVKPYLLLRDALHKSGHVAIAKIALRNRESLAVLRVYSDVMVLSTMLWPDEVRAADFPFLDEQAPEIRPQELTMAGSLIDSMADEVFDPRKYEDSYRAALEALIEAKIEGREVTVPEDGEQESNVVDLMSALSASVDAAKRGKESEPAEEKKPAAAKKSSGTKTSDTKTSGSKASAGKQGGEKSGTTRKSRSTKSA